MNAKITKEDSVKNRMRTAVDKVNRLIARWLTSNEQQLIERSHEICCKNQDAAILYILYKHFGFSPEQLKEYFDHYNEEYAYIEGDLDTSVTELPIVKELKDIGVDLDKWYEEAGI